jgi:hypothetical protein
MGRFEVAAADDGGRGASGATQAPEAISEHPGHHRFWIPSKSRRLLEPGRRARPGNVPSCRPTAHSTGHPRITELPPGEAFHAFHDQGIRRDEWRFCSFRPPVTEVFPGFSRAAWPIGPSGRPHVSSYAADRPEKRPFWEQCCLRSPRNPPGAETYSFGKQPLCPDHAQPPGAAGGRDDGNSSRRRPVAARRGGRSHRRQGRRCAALRRGADQGHPRFGGARGARPRGRDQWGC